jgi:hypothetical protein
VTVSTINWWTLPVWAGAVTLLGVIGLLICAVVGRVNQLNLYLLRTSYAASLIGLAAWALWFAAATAIYVVQSIRH